MDDAGGARAFDGRDCARAGADVVEQYADLPGVRLFYIDTGGTGVPVVLMHAATGSVRAWEHQMPAFTKAGYRVDLVRPPRLGPDRERGRRAARHGRRRSDRADGLTSTSIGSIWSARPPAASSRSTPRCPFRNASAASSSPTASAACRTNHSSSSDAACARPSSPRCRRAARGVAVVPRRQSRGHAPSGSSSNTSAVRPGRRRLRSRSRTAITFALLETITVPTLLLTGDADMFAPPPVMRMFAARIKHAETARRAGGRPLDILGTAGRLQPRRAELHSETLT